jgi:hypothetical protein
MRPFGYAWDELLIIACCWLLFLGPTAAMILSGRA